MLILSFFLPNDKLIRSNIKMIHLIAMPKVIFPLKLDEICKITTYISKMIAGHYLKNQICNIVRSCDNSVAYYCCKHLSACCTIIECRKQDIQHSMQKAISLPNLCEVKYRELKTVILMNELLSGERERDR